MHRRSVRKDIKELQDDTLWAPHQQRQAQQPETHQNQSHSTARPGYHRPPPFAAQVLNLLNPLYLLHIFLAALKILFPSHKMSSRSFSPSSIPSQAGKTILVTGATAGLGAQSVAGLAANGPKQIFLSGRNAQSAEKTISSLNAQFPDVKLEFVQMDLTSLKSVQAGAHRIAESAPHLDTVMLNAGVMATPAGVSADGYEVQWAANVLGHALLVKLLLPTLERTAEAGRDVRVISLTSTAQNMPFAGIDYRSLRSDQRNMGWVVPGAPWARYAQSKVGNLLYAQALASKHPNITSVSVHPGVIKTGLFAGVAPSAKAGAFLIGAVSKSTPVEEGWFNQVWAATCPKAELRSGEYYEPVGVVGSRSAAAKDPKGEKSDTLWAWLEDALRNYD